MWMPRSVPFGNYWRSRPLAFSFEPAPPGRLGATEVDRRTHGCRDGGVPGHLGSVIVGKAIWADACHGRTHLSAAAFSDEASLHDIVATSLELLPLSGAPSLAGVGGEALLGSGYDACLPRLDTGMPANHATDMPS